MIKQRIWIISELFYPDETSTGYILTAIANKLVEKFDVNVICGPEIYDKKKTIDKDSKQHLNSSIKLYRINEINLDKDKITSRLLRSFIASRRLYRLAKDNIKKEDKVLLVTNPPLLISMIAKLKKKIGFEFILLVHDIFPENAKAAGLKIPKIIYSLSKHYFDCNYAKADKLIAIGRDMKRVLEDKVKKKGNPKIEIIENWGDVEDIHPITTKEDHNNIIIGYAGNIGRGQGLMDFLEIFKDVKNKIISLHFWGTGAVEQQLKNFVAEHRLDNVFFHGPYFRSKQNEVLNACDIALVKLAKNMLGIGVPSKAYNILAAGKPILYIGHPDSEISQVVTENKIGYTFDNDDLNGIRSFLENLQIEDIEELNYMGKKARHLAEEKYAKSIILEKFANSL